MQAAAQAGRALQATAPAPPRRPRTGHGRRRRGAPAPGTAVARTPYRRPCRGHGRARPPVGRSHPATPAAGPRNQPHGVRPSPSDRWHQPMSDADRADRVDRRSWSPAACATSPTSRSPACLQGHHAAARGRRGLRGPWSTDIAEPVAGQRRRGRRHRGARIHPRAAVASRWAPASCRCARPASCPGTRCTSPTTLEYGTATIEVHADAFVAGARVLVVDDVLATGGTAGRDLRPARAGRRRGGRRSRSVARARLPRRARPLGSRAGPHHPGLRALTARDTPRTAHASHDRGHRLRAPRLGA